VTLTVTDGLAELRLTLPGRVSPVKVGAVVSDTQLPQSRAAPPVSLSPAFSVASVA
jgi:hypothetical protein